VELDDIAYSLDGEIFHCFREVEGGGPGQSGAGAADSTSDQKRGCGCRETSLSVQMAEDGGKLHRPLIIRLSRLSLPDAVFWRFTGLSGDKNEHPIQNLYNSVQHLMRFQHLLV
jgi:hypothetical protein